MSFLSTFVACWCKFYCRGLCWYVLLFFRTFSFNMSLFFTSIALYGCWSCFSFLFFQDSSYDFFYRFFFTIVRFFILLLIVSFLGVFSLNFIVLFPFLSIFHCKCNFYCFSFLYSFFNCKGHNSLYLNNELRSQSFDKFLNSIAFISVSFRINSSPQFFESDNIFFYTLL